jgi:hypothetical protein
MEASRTETTEEYSLVFIFESMSDEFIVGNVSDVKDWLRYRENLIGAGLEREE